MDKKQALVSVIVPAYNAEKFIAETIRSAQSQTYKNIEIVVCDDGSTDRTAEIVKNCSREDSRVKYFYQRNQGQSSSRNTAIAHASGEYVAFLDADDLFLPEKIEKQVGFLELHPECGLSYCKLYHFFSEKADEYYYFTVPHPSGLLFPELLRANFINPLSVVLRKKLLDTYGVFESSFRRVDEQYLWLKLSYNGVRFCYLDEPLGLYRVHSQSLSNENVYFKETEETFLKLLQTMRGWMSPEEARNYQLDELEKKTKRRIIVGKLMAGRNVFAKLAFYLYNLKRKNRFEKVMLQ